MRGGQPSVGDKSASRAIAAFVRGLKQRKISDFLRPPCELSETSAEDILELGIRVDTVLQDPPGVHRNDPVVEARETTLIFRDQLRIEAHLVFLGAEPFSRR